MIQILIENLTTLVLDEITTQEPTNFDGCSHEPTLFSQVV